MYGKTRFFLVATIVLHLFFLTSLAQAQGVVTWNFDLTTAGQDVFWTSPTATDTTAPRFRAAWNITLADVHVVWAGIPFGPIDITNNIPPADRVGETVVTGPPPVVIQDAFIVFPAPPQPVTFSGWVRQEIDAQGFGQFSVTQVTLGTAMVDLGFPFGMQTVQITSVHLAGTTTVTPLGPQGDLNGDGAVDQVDRSLLIQQFGLVTGSPGFNPEADLNFDGIVNELDIALFNLILPPCPADCAPNNGPGNIGNGVVNIDDLVAVLNAFGPVVNNTPCDITPANLNGSFGNSVVNIDDLVAVLNGFGLCP